MKKLTLLLLAVLYINTIQAQDIIIKLSGDELHVKVMEITLTDVLYHKPDSLQGRIYSVPKAEVFMVKYANGAKEVITQFSSDEDSLHNSALTRQQLYEKGRQDARRYYNGNDVLWGSAGATLVLGITGPIIIGAIPPKIKPSQVPQISLLQNPDYTQGYKAQAHKKKIGKAAIGAGIGTAASIVLLILAFSAAY